MITVLDPTFRESWREFRVDLAGGDDDGASPTQMSLERQVGRGILQASKVVRMARGLTRLRANTGKKDGWITIGAKDGEGGTPVKLKNGRIVSGPAGLKDKKLSEIADKHDPNSRLDTTIREQAKAHGVRKRDLKAMVHEVWEQQRDAVIEREAAKKAARSITGVTQQDISRLENQHKDHTALKGFDATAREVARQFPELGLGSGYEGGANYDDTDYAAGLWEILKEGKQEPPAKHDMAVIKEAARRIVEDRKRSKSGDDDSFDFGANAEAYEFGLRLSSEFSPAKFSSTQFNLPPDLLATFFAMASRIDKDDLAEDGIETQPHITVKYGLHTNNADEVRESVGVAEPVAVSFGETSVFASDKHDVVKVEIDSKGLRALNEAVSALPHTDTHPTYQPHLTIAYVKPGLGQKYADTLKDLQGKVAVFDRLIFSDQSRQHVSFPLIGKPKRFANDDPKRGGDPVNSGRFSKTGGSGSKDSEPMQEPAKRVADPTSEELLVKSPVPVTKATTTFGGDADVAKNWAMEHLRGMPIHNKDTGMVIHVGRKAIKKATSGSALQKSRTTDQFDALHALPSLLHNAVLGEARPDQEGDPNIDRIYRFYAPLQIGDSLYRTKLTVKGYVIEPAGYYTHELTEIEVPTLKDSAARSEEPTSETNVGTHVSISDLLRGATKENGDPLI